MLRGVHDSRIPLVIALIGYWAIGAPVGARVGICDPARRGRRVDRPRARPRGRRHSPHVALAQQGAARFSGLTSGRRSPDKRPGLQTFQISDFRQHQHFGPTIADRVWNAWWRNSGREVSDVERHMIEMADDRPLPMAIVAHNDLGYLGSAFLIHSDMEERPQYSPWVAAVWVEAAERKRGVGRALIVQAAKTADSLGYRRGLHLLPTGTREVLLEHRLEDRRTGRRRKTPFDSESSPLTGDKSSRRVCHSAPKQDQRWSTTPPEIVAMSEPAEPFVIDVDTGIDDALALLYACAHEEAQILGVSTVVGNVPLAAATRNTRAVLKLAGRADIPVWPGAPTALSISVRDASEVHGKTGLGHAVLPEPEEQARRFTPSTPSSPPRAHMPGGSSSARPGR